MDKEDYIKYLEGLILEKELSIMLEGNNSEIQKIGDLKQLINTIKNSEW